MRGSLQKSTNDAMRAQQKEEEEEEEEVLVQVQVSATNARLRRPSWAASLAKLAVASDPAAAAISRVPQYQTTATTATTALLQQLQQDDPTNSSLSESSTQFRVVLGLGPGRSGTKSLTELLGAQSGCCRAEHEMIIPRNNKNNNRQHRQITTKGSWGADRRLEWDSPRLEGAMERTEEESAKWRVGRLLEQREAWNEWSNGEQQTKKLGARGWKEYNKRKSSNNQQAGATGATDTTTTNNNAGEGSIAKVPFVAAVSSVALAYVHEYVALDPSVRVVVVTRPREEVVASFLRKTVGRNHWQQPTMGHHRCGNKEDKTWDKAFPDMTDEECQPFVEANTDPESDESGEPTKGTKPEKAAALRAYWELYNDTAKELSQRYPNNVRIFDMDAVLNESREQEALLRWCGFDEPLRLDTTVRLNRSPKCV
jgi:hypothetical protein